MYLQDHQESHKCDDLTHTRWLSKDWLQSYEVYLWIDNTKSTVWNAHFQIASRIPRTEMGWYRTHYTQEQPEPHWGRELVLWELLLVRSPTPWLPCSIQVLTRVATGCDRTGVRASLTNAIDFPSYNTNTTSPSVLQVGEDHWDFRPFVLLVKWFQFIRDFHSMKHKINSRYKPIQQ